MKNPADKEITVILHFYGEYDTSNLLQFNYDRDLVMSLYGDVFTRFNAETRKMEIYY